MTSTFFPEDEYTPYGLLDNPWHTWKISRRGTFRTNQDLGVDWLFPNSQRPSLRLRCRMMVNVGSEWQPIGQFCRRVGALPAARYHSKNAFRIVFRGVDAFSIEWIPLDDALLGFRVVGVPPEAEGLALELAASGGSGMGLWEFGWVARILGPRCLMLREFAEGQTFALLLSSGSPVHAVLDFRDRENQRGWSSGREGVGAGVWWQCQSPKMVVEGVISLGWSEAAALARAEQALGRFRELRTQRLAEDEEFWAQAPRLVGDWSAHWRRGWVYDYETLRMVVRRPTGIFARRWDGMQVQKPRLVLAETALDAWALAPADPGTAKEIIATAFHSARADNVPCVREDGSTNMVAEDGSECGTGPNWCLPFSAIRDIFALTGDLDWARQLLPRLEAYVRWWLQNRVDGAGWAFFKCSWESGQDSSPRFGVPQPTGGELVEHLKPVDLYAGLLDAIRTVLLLRGQLGLAADDWPTLARRFRERLRRMWRGDGFYDLDAREGAWVNDNDLSCLTPFAVSGSWPLAWKKAARARLRRYREQPEVWLEWPSFWLIFAEAAQKLGERALLTETLGWRADSVYKAWDARTWDERSPVPGTAAECWGIDQPRGAEGYGWGATLPLHILRGFFGLRVCGTAAPRQLRFSPSFPTSWPNGSYGVQGLAAFGGVISAVAHVEAGRVTLEVRSLEDRTPLRVVTGKVVEQTNQRVIATMDQGESLILQVTRTEDSSLRI